MRKSPPDCPAHDPHTGTPSHPLFSRYNFAQVMTGESWSEAVARPVIFGSSPILAAVFFVSFILFTQVILINVVVAVL